MEDIRSYNVGNSDYAKHKYQSWDFWIRFKITCPFDADICKRILRIKPQDGRELDYKKIIHICGERLRQLALGPDAFPALSHNVSEQEFKEMIADYAHLTEDDISILRLILFPVFSDRSLVYENIKKILEKYFTNSQPLFIL